MLLLLRLCVALLTVVQSKTRNAVDGGKSKLFGSGKAAFRFLIDRKVALEDPITRPLVEKGNVLSMWYGSDRRIVMYPCNDNETLNFVLIHPDTESHATPGDGMSQCQRYHVNPIADARCRMEQARYR